MPARRFVGLLNNIDKFWYDGSAGFREKSAFNKNSQFWRPALPAI
jgi:hypothetical protein